MPIKEQAFSAGKAAAPQPAPQETHQPAQRDATRGVQRPAGGPGAFGPSDMIALQRTVGNRAMGRMLGTHTAPQPATTALVQRLPTRKAVEHQLGAPDNVIKIGGFGLGGSSYYKAVLEALTHYQLFIVHNLASSVTLAKLMAHYDAVQKAVDNYIAEKDENLQKLAYMQKLRVELAFERSQARVVSDRLDHAGPQANPPLWSDAFKDPRLSQLGQRKELMRDTPISDADLTGDTARGGTNEVAHVKVGAETHFFKADKNEIPLVPLLYEQSKGSGYGKLLPNTRYAGMEDGAMENEYQVPLDAGIINKYSMPEREKKPNLESTGDPERDRQLRLDDDNRRNNNYKAEVEKKAKQTGFREQIDLHYARRDVAMYRLDQLFGAGVIAPAQLALRKMGNEYVEGSLMKGAKGTAMKDLLKGGALKSDDAVLQRLLSRLQLLDTLAFQVDRNMGNFYLETDSQSRATNLTGIDNDMSFGKNPQDLMKKRRTYPGLSKFVDAELAERIIALHPDELANAVFGLLSQAEITALLTRLGELQKHLRALKDQELLLKPNQWNLATAQALKQENRSYYAELQLPLPPTPDRPGVTLPQISDQVQQQALVGNNMPQIEENVVSIPQQRPYRPKNALTPQQALVGNSVPQLGNNVPQIEEDVPARQDGPLPVLLPSQNAQQHRQRRPRKIVFDPRELDQEGK